MIYLFGPVLLAAAIAGIIAGLASLPFLRPRSSGVVLVSVTALYFPAWFWWVLGLYVGVYPTLHLTGTPLALVPPALWALLGGAWIVVRLAREARGRAPASGVYLQRLLQFGGVALLAFVVIGVEGTARIVRARGGAPSLLGPYLFLTICCAILLAFVSFVYVRERDPEIVLLLLVLTIGAVLPIVILGRLWSV